MHLIRSLTFVALLLSAPPGFADDEVGEEADNDLPEMRRPRMNQDCVRINRIRSDDYEFLDHRNLVVWAGRRNPYHLELSRSCQAASSLKQVTFRGRGGLLCGGPGDFIELREPFGRFERRDDPFEDRCQVRRVRALGEEGLYELMIELDRIPPPPPLPPPEVEVATGDAESVVPAAQSEEEIVDKTDN